jgi:predicted Zn-dependent protease
MICKSIFTKLFLLLVLLSLASACSSVTGTGRSQLNLVSDSEINQMASLQYKELLQEAPLSKDKQKTQMIKNVGARISKAAEQMLRDYNRPEEIADYKWEFNLIESDEVNAFCMPGGKVAFYTGILPICETEAGVAAVMGHEVAHAIAKHGNERVSQQTLASTAGSLLSIGLGIGGASSVTADLVLTAYSVGSQYGVLLPFSRTHEAEADRIGMSLMAMAGYEPTEAISFWERMGKKSSGSTPFFFSTHPSDKQRVKNLNKYLEEAQTRYVPYKAVSGKKAKKK